MDRLEVVGTLGMIGVCVVVLVCMAIWANTGKTVKAIQKQTVELMALMKEQTAVLRLIARAGGPGAPSDTQDGTKGH